MLAALALSAAALAAPAAVEVSDSGVEHSVSVRPLQLREPSVHLRYDRRLSSSKSVYGTVNGGRFGTPATKLLEAAIEESLPVELHLKQVGASVGVRHAFKNFESGWGVGVELGLQRRTLALEMGEMAGGESATLVTLGPRVGWTRVLKNKVVVAADAGPHLVWTARPAPSGWDGSGLRVQMNGGEPRPTRGGADVALRIGYAF